ncbi:hypothetical protein PV325_009097 [Microctonus aethiopoides]|nr:hypothetical protein PV325_009097 [Microctonus aethiopoides]
MVASFPFSIADQTYSVGAYKALHEVPQNIHQSLLDYGLEVEQYKKFKYLRLLKHKKLYMSDEYRKVMQTSSSAMQYFDNADNQMKCGLVQHFLRLIDNQCKHNNCNCQIIHLAIVKEVVCDSMFQADGNHREMTLAHQFDDQEYLSNDYWGPERIVEIPKTSESSLGLSIVGGKVVL